VSICTTQPGSDDKDLDTLSYEYYMKCLEKKGAASARGHVRLIQTANDHYFKTRNAAILVLLCYRGTRRIVGDNSGNAFIDTVIQLNPSDSIPSLGVTVWKMRF
jgi:hypothetical protein